MNYTKVFRLKVVSSLIAAVLFFLPVHAHAQTTPVLLYNGTGSSPTDVIALQNLLNAMGLKYQLADASQINAMSLATLKSYKLILWPGGNSIEMGAALSTSATALVRKAIVEGGVSYFGICAGAFMAEKSSSLYNVFNLASTWFSFYQQGMTDMVSTSFADGKARSLVYWDGPQFVGFGSIVAKYPNGKAAIAAAKVGKGLVVLSGVHPEAPSDWRWGFATQDSDGVPADLAYTQTLITAAVNKTMPQTFK